MADVVARVYSEIGHDENTDPHRERDLHEAWAAVYRALGADAVPPRLASAAIPWWPV
jgi:hypothetical protein